MTIIKNVLGRFEQLRMKLNELYQHGQLPHSAACILREKLAFLEGALTALKQSEDPEWTVSKGRTTLMDKLNLQDPKNES